MEPDFFSRLLELPLFQGIGKNEFWKIAEKVRFDFKKYPPGTSIVEQGDACTHLIFIINGQVHAVRRSDHYNYTLHEWLPSPMVLQPASLFGLTTRYSRGYHAEEEVQTLRVDKRAVCDVLFSYSTFRYNYLNFLSFQAQQTERRLWAPLLPDLTQRFVAFLTVRSERLAGRKELNIKMEQLAEELDATRLNVSRMLNCLQTQNLILLRRERILLPAFQRLLQAGSGMSAVELPATCLPIES